MKKTRNRILSLVLTLCMVLSLLPMGAVTAGAVGEAVTLGSAMKASGANQFKLEELAVSGLDAADVSLIQVTVTGGTVKGPGAEGAVDGWTALPIIGNTSLTLTATNKKGADAQTALRTLLFDITGATMTVDVMVSTKKTSITAGAGSMLTPGADGHYYMFVSTAANNGTTPSWPAAYAAAKSNIFMGMKGYLATITSAEEDQLLQKISTQGAWSGGAALSTESDDGDTFIGTFGSDNFQWACGPEANGTGADTVYYNSRATGGSSNGAYNKWDGPEPNGNPDGVSKEYCMQVNYGGQHKWNDMPDEETNGPARLVRGYFVEFGGYVPDPGDTANGANYSSAQGSFTTSSIVEKPTTVALTVTPGAHMQVTTNTNGSSVEPNKPIADIVLTADAGYVLPANYAMGSGLTFTRLTDTTGKVTGSIAGAVTVTIQDATPDVSQIKLIKSVVGSTAVLNFSLPAGLPAEYAPTATVTVGAGGTIVPGSVVTGKSFSVLLTGTKGVAYTVTPKVTNGGKDYVGTSTSVTLTEPHGKTMVTLNPKKQTDQTGIMVGTPQGSSPSGQIQTTSNNGGWFPYGVDTNGTSEVTVAVVANQKATIKQGNKDLELWTITAPYKTKDNAFSKVTLVLRNPNATKMEGCKFGLTADVKIGGDDSATIYPQDNGFSMTDNTNILAMINNLNDDSLPENEFKWWGGRDRVYFPAKSSTESFGGADSFATVSFKNISLEPGEMKSFSVAFGAGGETIKDEVNNELGNKYAVAITKGNGIANITNNSQANVVPGTAITPMVVTAAAGYTLPATWTDASLNGLVYTRGATPFTTATISGTPTAAVTATVPNATAITYQVVYNGNTSDGGTAVSGSTLTYDIAGKAAANTFTKTGYTFNGWNTQTDGNGTAYAVNANLLNLKNTQGEVVTLYAQWKINSYELTLTLAHATVTGNSNTTPYDYNEAVNVNLSANTGYLLPATLSGDTLTAAGLTYTQGVDDKKTATIKGNITQAAAATISAEPITYTIKYNSNGGDGGATAQSTHTYDAEKALTANGFTKTGYDFNGWSTTEGVVAKTYDNNQSVKNLKSTQGETLELYAQWTASTYTVSYNANGGTGTTATSSHVYGGTTKLTANNFTRTGYTFAGWNTAENGTGTPYTAVQPVGDLTSSITLYAQWTANTYTVKFEAGIDGTGVAMADQHRTYGDNTPLTTNTYTKAHYHFTGWKDGNDNVVAAGSTANLTSTAGATVTLTAQWTVDVYAVKITAGTGMTLSGNAANQNITYPGAITQITVTAEEGYVLPTSWAVGNGLIYTRAANGKTATITGNPTAAVTATVPAASQMTPGVDKGGKGLITVTTDPGKEYKITPNTGVTAVDKDGVTVTPDTDGWVNTNNGPITFKPLNPGVDYTVSTRPKEDTGAPTGGNGTDEVIPVPAIGGNVHATKDPGDETKIQIIIDPASAALKYAVLDAGGTTQIYPTSAGTWITDTESPIIITLPGLTAGTKYQIVAVPADTEAGVKPLDKKDKGTTITTPTVDIGTGVVVSKVDRLPVTPATSPATDKIVIAAPTDTGKDYGVTDPATGVTEWKTGTGSELTFDKLDPHKKYEVSIRENNKPSGEPSVPSVGVTVDVNITTTSITGGYVKGTPSPENDKTTITVTSPETNLDYGIVDETGATKGGWLPGTGTVKFEGLRPGKDYKVVTRPHNADKTAKPAVNEIPGGTGIVTPVPPVDPDKITREVDTGHDGRDKITINPTTTGQVYTLVNPGTGAVLAGPTISTGDPITFDTLDPNTKYEVAVVKPGVDGGVGVPGKGVVVGKIGVASVSSTVKDEDGNPVVGATVSITVATTDGGFRTITTTTDKDGKYTISGDDIKLPGGYAIYVDGGAKGCETLPVTLTVAQPQAIADITTKVANKNIFGGVVTTVDGKPVKDATVKVINKSTGLEVPPPAGSVTTTKDGGGYVIEKLVDGTYIIQTTKDGKSGMTEIVVKDGKILPNTEGGFKNTNISTAPGGIVAGKITGLGEGEKAKVTITVPIVDEHGAIIGTKNVTAQAVGTGGHYQFAGVPDGDYPVTVVGPDGKLTVSTITVGSGAATGGNITIPTTKPEKPNVVTGIVMDKNGKPVPGATVKLYDKTGALVTPTKPATVTTGEGGGWAVKGLDPEKGPFTVTVDKDGTNGVAGPVTVDVSGKVTGKTNVELLGTVALPGGTVTPDVAGKLLTGKVTDSAGKPAEGATVVVKDSAGNVIAKTTTNKDGIYFVPNVPTGATVTVITKTGENGKPGSLSGNPLNGNTTTTKPGSETLTVIGPKGEVLPVTKSTESDTVAHIAVVGVAPTVNPDAAKVKITGDKLDVSDLPDGTYKVTVTQNGMTLTKDIEVKNHAIVGDNTMTATSKTVEGKLDYGSGAVPADATVTIKGGSPADYIWGSAIVNPKDGSYKITGIPEGSYTVEVKVKNPEDASKNVTITNTVTVTKDGAVTFGSDWAADKGADITTGTGGKLTVTPSTAVKAIIDSVAAVLTKPDPAATALEIKAEIDKVTGLTDEESKQVAKAKVKELSDKLQELLKTKLTVAADATGVTAATKDATKGVLNDQKGLLVTGDEVTAAASKTVKVGLTLDAENVTSNPPADKNKAEAAAKGGDIGAFFDISVTKTTEIKEGDVLKSTATEKVPVLPVAVPVTLAIPAEIQGHAYYNVIRVHNGVAERIPATATETTVSFLSSLYSTYAIAYSDDPIFTDDKPVVGGNTDGGNTGGSTSGGNGGAAVQPVTGGSVTTSPKNPKPGDKVTITVDPDKGYKVDTVKVLDKNGKEVAVTKNDDGTYTYIQPKGTVTIDATFKKDGAGAQVGPFTDVTSDQWFAEAVEFVYNEKLFNGVAADKFGPQITTTRGMFVTILGRLAKIDVTKWTAQSKFPDVHTDMYCAPYIAWGEDQGIVLGFDDGSYRPDDLVTREQMAAILYRYVQKTGTLDLAKTHELTYADKADIADWALDAVTWCTGEKVLSGRGNNLLVPTANANRAEVAQLIFNFCHLKK